jgi:hypothetical protein
MVALGEDGKPVLLQALEPETADEQRRHRAAQRRRSIRLADPDASLHILAMREFEPPPA